MSEPVTVQFTDSAQPTPANSTPSTLKGIAVILIFCLAFGFIVLINEPLYTLYMKYL